MCGAVKQAVAHLDVSAPTSQDPCAPLANLVASSAGSALLLTVLLRIVAGATLPDAGGLDADAVPATATPFIAMHPGDGAILAGIALAVALLGVGGTGVPVLAMGPAVLPAAWRPAAAFRANWLRFAGPAVGALAASAIWRATVG